MSNASYLVIGYGGIGQAITSHLLAEKKNVTVITHHLEHQADHIHHLDLTKPDQVRPLLQIMTTVQPTYIINTIGQLMANADGPEKNIKQIKLEWLESNIEVNVWPSIQIAHALSQVKKRADVFKFMSFSARVSSIGDNHLGGWYSYRMSKSMLNMFIKTLSIEWQRQFPNAVVCGYHPGTVDTELSRPFHANVPADKLFSPDAAANYCLSVLEQMSTSQTGQLFDWQGKKIEW